MISRLQLYQIDPSCLSMCTAVATMMIRCRTLAPMLHSLVSHWPKDRQNLNSHRRWIFLFRFLSIFAIPPVVLSNRSMTICPRNDVKGKKVYNVEATGTMCYVCLHGKPLPRGNRLLRSTWSGNVRRLPLLLFIGRIGTATSVEVVFCLKSFISSTSRQM